MKIKQLKEKTAQGLKDFLPKIGVNDIEGLIDVLNDKLSKSRGGEVKKPIVITNDNSNYICRLSSDEVRLPLTVRTRKMGDRIAIKGMNGTKKLKDIFIDMKIGKEERDLWPVVVDSLDRIVWIPGIKKSKFDKKNEESYDIILKYC